MQATGDEREVCDVRRARAACAQYLSGERGGEALLLVDHGQALVPRPPQRQRELFDLRGQRVLLHGQTLDLPELG
jgi:hypothetical protein